MARPIQEMQRRIAHVLPERPAQRHLPRLAAGAYGYALPQRVAAAARAPRRRRASAAAISPASAAAHMDMHSPIADAAAHRDINSPIADAAAAPNEQQGRHEPPAQADHSARLAAGTAALSQ